MYSQRRRFLEVKSATLALQAWFRSKRERLQFLKLKRSVADIQYRARKLIKQRKAIAHLNAVVTVQRWVRSMRDRFNFLKIRRSVRLLQSAYRDVYMKRRIGAAVCIQAVWRGMRARKLRKQLEVVHREKKRIEMELRRLHLSAVRIQALWRGYRQRKQTGPALNCIRSRLSSIYVKGSSSSSSAAANTLGARIRTSLEILKYPCHPIQQIMLALTDLVKVTKLSPECCLFFTRQGAVSTLYTFILNCNRSVPHLDLIKLCIQVFQNLAKYPVTQGEVITPDSKAMDIVMNMLQAYYVSNPEIFMHVCVLLIILAEKYEDTKRQIVSDATFLRKLEQIYAGLERRVQFTSHGSSNSSQVCLF